MQQFRHEDTLQVYYHSFTFNREDVPELTSENYEEVPLDMCDPDKNELFIKSKVYYDEKETEKTRTPRKEGSPRKIFDWRSDNQNSEYRTRQDDVRLRDRHYFKKKEKKRDEMPIWRLPPQ